jgi:primosomal protein N' (replication factor Y)
VFGPVEAPIAVIRGRHRFRLLAKAARNFDLSGYLRGWLAGVPKAEAGVKLEADVDPVSFL